MKVTLQVNGRKITVSGVENITILEETAKTGESTKKVSIQNTVLVEEPSMPEEKWLLVDAKAIDMKLFEKRGEEKGESARQLILEAFEEVKKNPNKYARKFSVMIPQKNIYTGKTFGEIINTLKESDCHMADWVELALMWAQRISNGESWEVLYNSNKNTSVYHRAVIWKNNQIAYIGGSIIPYVYEYPEQYVHQYFLNIDDKNRAAVPVIASHTLSAKY